MSLKKVDRKKKKTYAVRDIIDYKVENGVEWFLVFWVGCSKAESTWEPIQSLENGGFEYLIQQWREIQSKNRLKPKSKKAKLMDEQPKQKNFYLKSYQQLSNHAKHMLEKLYEYSLKYINSPQYVEQQKMKAQGLQKELRSDSEMQEEKAEQLSYLEPPTIEKASQNQSSIEEEVLSSLGKSVNERIEKNKKIKKTKEKQKRIYKAQTFQQPTFKDLPARKIQNRINFRGEILYELQIDYQCATSQQPVIFHQKYVKTYWPQLLTKFEEKEREIGQSAREQEI